MEKSRTSRRFKQAGFFTVVLILGNLLLSGCGQHSTVTGVLGVGGALGQQTFDDQGSGDQSQIDQRPYLALAPDDERKSVTDLVPANDANKQLASQVIAATVTRVGVGVEVQIRMTSSKSPLIFKGDLKETDYLAYIGNFPESSGQRSDLTLYVSCSDQSCRHTDLFLSDNQGRKAAIVVSTEDRILTTTVPDGETADQVKGLFNIPQKTKVHYNLTETSPGVSTYTVSTIETHPKIIAEGPIQNTENGLVNAQSEILDKTETAALAGVDENNLIFNIASTPDPKKPGETKNVIVNISAADGVTVRPKPITQKNPTTPAAIPEKCKVHDLSEVNSMVNDVLKECNEVWVNKTMKSWWFTEYKLSSYKVNVRGKMQQINIGGNKGGFKDFMNLYEASKTAEGKSRDHDFKTMVDVLHANNFPTVWSWITQVESTFWYDAKGGAGELGVWQISPGTRAKPLNISNQAAIEIKPATEAAIRYYKILMASNPPNNIPMLLAAYNMGQGNADQGMAILMKAHRGNDFWRLCDMALHLGTCKYVSEIVSGMILSLDPKDYGMTNIGAMEAK